MRLKAAKKIQVAVWTKSTVSQGRITTSKYFHTTIKKKTKLLGSVFFLNFILIIDIISAILVKKYSP